jgi:hypothetical protein
VQVEDDGDGIVIFVSGSGTGLGYPFVMDDFWSIFHELDLAADCERALRELECQISEIEGFDVSVDIDYYHYDGYEEDELVYGRRVFGSGRIIAFPRDYPYRRAMSGRKTIGDWQDRFTCEYPGLEVSVSNYGLPSTTPLSDLRGH